MHRLLLCLLVFVLAAGSAVSAAPRQPEFIPGQYIALLDETAGEPGAAAAALARRHGLGVGHVYRAALRGFSFRANPAAAQALAHQPGVLKVMPDVRVHAFAQTLPTGVCRIDTALLKTPICLDGKDDQPNIDIAVIDTGIGPHDDLRIAGGVNVAGGTSYADDNGHGTHVAGIAAAIDNDFGVVGVCPGARLWAVKVLDAGGSGSLSNVAAGVDWVADTAKHPGYTIKVANMSLGAYYPTYYELIYGDPLKTAVQNASAQGVHFAVAAANDAADAADYIPARYDTVVCTSALVDTDGEPFGGGPATGYGNDDTFASFSNYGSVVDVIAPGVSIYATAPNNAYATHSGTSMASPHTAGVIADYLLAHPGTSPADMLQVIRSNGEAAPATGWPGDGDSIAELLVNLPLLLNGDTPPPPVADFVVQVKTSRATYTRKQSVMITVQATDLAGKAIVGAPVSCTVTDPRGTAATATGVTDSRGMDIFLITTTKRDAPGTWKVEAQVTANGATRTGSTTFRLK